MKVRIDWDEWYPVYEISDSGITVKIDQETAERWMRVRAEFDAVQEEMLNAIESCKADE